MCTMFSRASMGQTARVSMNALFADRHPTQFLVLSEYIQLQQQLINESMRRVERLMDS